MLCWLWRVKVWWLENPLRNCRYEISAERREKVNNNNNNLVICSPFVSMVE